ECLVGLEGQACQLLPNVKSEDNWKKRDTQGHVAGLDIAS
ncbi:14327_t:CDS:1, partial [Gigaspora margarita]